MSIGKPEIQHFAGFPVFFVRFEIISARELENNALKYKIK